MIAEGRGTALSEEVPVNWNVTTPGYFAALATSRSFAAATSPLRTTPPRRR